MTTYKSENKVFENERGYILISCYREKFSAVDFWRVDLCQRYGNKEYFSTISKDLLNKPNKRQITRYIENYL